MSDFILTPDSNQKLVEGSVVKLARFPEIRWILHNGWYSYNGKQSQGWYFSSIPSQTILPVSTSDLYNLYIVSNNDSLPDYPLDIDPFPPYMPHEPCRPCPPPYAYPCDPWNLDKPAAITLRYKRLLDSAFVSVNTIADRDAIDTNTIPDGKIFRVNYVADYNGPHYYIWNEAHKQFDDWNITFSDDVQSDIDAKLQPVKQSVESNTTSISNLTQTVNENNTSIDSRITPIENMFKNIKESNHVIISDNQTITDSGYTLGSDTISEDDHTLATDKAVTTAIQSNAVYWEDGCN